MKGEIAARRKLRFGRRRARAAEGWRRGVSRLGVLLVAVLIAPTAGAAQAGVYSTAEQPAPMLPLAEDGIHDPSNPALAALQNPKESMAEFPKDRRGEVDWVRTLRSGLINPRKSITGDEYGGKEVMQTMDLDIIFTNTQQMPHVRFPHLAHTEWLACSNCHPAIFLPQRGANPIAMEKILKGEFCGRCHDKVSFSLYNCERCHSIPHAGSGPAWWQ